MNKEQALKIAEQYSLEEEVKISIKNGNTPEESLKEWDIKY